MSKPVAEEDLILYILGGLSADYDAFITSITTLPISLDDLYGRLLLSPEIRLSDSNLHNLSSEPSANLANRSHSTNNNNSRGRGRSLFQSRGRGRGRGRGL